MELFLTNLQMCCIFVSSDPFASSSSTKACSSTGTAGSSVFGFEADPFATSFAATTSNTTPGNSATSSFGSSDPFGSFGDFNSFAPTSSSVPAAKIEAAKKGDVVNLLDL